MIGTESEEEMMILQQWKKEAQNGAQKLMENWEPDTLIEGYKSYKTVDKNKAWEKVNAQISRSGIVQSNSVFMKIAAVLVIMFVALAGFYMYNSWFISSDLIVSNQKVTEDKLLDGTSVVLDQNTTLRVLSDRNVSLEGRCFFDVVKSPSEPFTVLMQHGKLEVLGTQFVISTEKNKTTVFVHEGKVRVDYNKNSWTLQAGDKLTLENNTSAVLENIANIDPLTWKSGQIIFRDESLQRVLQTLALHFNMEIVFENSSDRVDNCKINTSFNDFSVDGALKELSLIAGLEYQIISGKIMILDFKC